MKKLKGGRSRNVIALLCKNFALLVLICDSKTCSLKNIECMPQVVSSFKTPYNLLYSSAFVRIQNFRHTIKIWPIMQVGKLRDNGIFDIQGLCKVKQTDGNSDLHK